MTPEKLRSYTSKDLAQMARRAGIEGWHGMRKEQLISSLASVSLKAKTASHGTEKGKPKAAKPKKKRPTAAQRRAAERREQQQRLNDLSTTWNDESQGDRLIVLVRDPYWLHVSWEIAPESVSRAQTALGQNWHGAKPVLRVFRVEEDGSVAGGRQVPIHGGVSHWYVDVIDPPARYRTEIGYAAESGDFYCLARSNEVTTPAPGSSQAVDGNWTDVARNADRVYAMSGGYSNSGASRELQEALEQRLRRRLGRPTETRFGSTLQGAGQGESLGVEVEAELIVYGSTHPHSHLTVQGEPVAVQADGGFAVKMPFPA